MADVKQIKAQLEALMEQVEQMERGGDLEGLLEEGLSAIKQTTYEAALERRERAAAQADFSPSELSALRRADASRGD